ncbi:MAG: hypothetical protein AAFV88_15125 [Planctomycetota bacterium]
MKFGLATLLLAALYIAICCLVYIEPSYWIGTLVVAATIALLVGSSARAFMTRSVGLQVFSVVGLGLIAFLLGFYAETPPGSQTWQVPRKVYTVFTLGIDLSPSEEAGVYTQHGVMHSFHVSSGFGSRTGSRPRVPTYHNVVRMGICTSSVFLASCVGCLSNLLARKFRQGD